MFYLTENLDLLKVQRVSYMYQEVLLCPVSAVLG